MSKLFATLKALLRALGSSDREPQAHETMSLRELADLPSFHETRGC